MNHIQFVRNLRIRGLVQGIGFRDAMIAEATRLGGRGWVRNRSDGTVEATITGADEALLALLAWARRGPPGARVEGIVVTELTSPGITPARFERRPTI